MLGEIEQGDALLKQLGGSSLLIGSVATEKYAKPDKLIEHDGTDQPDSSTDSKPARKEKLKPETKERSR